MCNMTAWLPHVPRAASVLDAGFQAWVLGIFTDDDRPTTAELSLPIAFSGHYFTDFGKRIMLLTGDDNEGIGRKLGDDPDNDAVEIVDIAVRRK